MKEYYSLLYLTDSASEEDVKIAYKKLAKKFHPDKNEGSNDFIEEFKLIQNAYEKIMQNFEEQKIKYAYGYNKSEKSKMETEAQEFTTNPTVDIKENAKVFVKKTGWFFRLIFAVVGFAIIKVVISLAIKNNNVKSQNDNYTTDNTINVQPISNEKSCDKSVRFGNIDVCLPEIDGMTECYSNPMVKERADNTEYEGNSELGFYLNNETYKKVNKINEINFDDYFKIYATKSFAYKKFELPELNNMANKMEGNYIKTNWSELKKKAEKNRDFVSIGKPVLLDSYIPNKNIRTFVMLTKYNVDNTEFIMVATLNMVLIKEHLIWLAYYKNYNGEESINKAKSKNDYIVLRLDEENK